MTSIDDYLRKLRYVTDELDWFECQRILEALLGQLDVEQIIKVTIYQVGAYLPLFERYHPAVVWPRKLLSLLFENQPIEGSFLIYGEGFRSPGSNGFLEALGLAQSAALHKKDRRKCIDLATGAIVTTIGAMEFEYWARTYPDRWNNWQKLDPNAVNLPTVESPYLDSKVQQYAASLWNMLTDYIEKEFGA